MDVTISDDITVVKTDSDSNCSFFKLPQRKRLFFVLMAFSNFLISTCFSILAPFFPAKVSVFLYLLCLLNDLYIINELIYIINDLYN